MEGLVHRGRLERRPPFPPVPDVRDWHAADGAGIRRRRLRPQGRRGDGRAERPDCHQGFGTDCHPVTIPEAEYLYRLSYDPRRPNRLLISGQFRGGELFSWSYAPGTGELLSVADSGVPAYKCAFWDGRCYYAERLAGFEERRIVRTEHLEYTPLDAKAHIVETFEYGSGANAPKEFE